MPQTTAPDAHSTSISAAIMRLLLPYHRTTDHAPAPMESFWHQRRRIGGFVGEGDPVVFTLPGFPCKSPNPAKVLGHLPDQGERLSSPFSRPCARTSNGSTHRAPGSSSAPTATSSATS